MTTPIISFSSVAGSLFPIFILEVTNEIVGDVFQLQYGRDNTFVNYDGLIASTLNSTGFYGLAVDLTVGALCNGTIYFRISHNGVWSNIISDVISGSVSCPAYGASIPGKSFGLQF